jgi:hypothetical protein
MAKASFVSTEPLFIKFIYYVGFVGVFYVLYENIFLNEENHSGILIYVLVLFGFFRLRRINALNKYRKLQNKTKIRDL